MKNILPIIFCLIILGSILPAAGTPIDVVDANGKEILIIITPIIGFYPQIHNETIDFWFLIWFIIQKERFQGYVGENLIFGFYIKGGPVFNTM
jgi:hypothetical protein